MDTLQVGIITTIVVAAVNVFSRLFDWAMSKRNNSIPNINTANEALTSLKLDHLHEGQRDLQSSITQLVVSQQQLVAQIASLISELRSK